ncbi:internal virion protein [Enterobacter phage phiEap-1]|uniref:Internal virion protein n=1 Tax=Enterobacter phage phiEap-1 TaxID=1587520 RepID=A0A0K2FHH3_9CAUD|nr:internal virion protein [Enterobacter phage phiEap-1]ALA45096.1 internal virion protein [Enterobacter phage phiEap-1]
MYIRKTISNDFELFTPAYHDLLEAKAMGIEPSFPEASECVTLDHGGFPLAIGGNQGDQVWFVTSDQVWRLNRALKVRFHRTICEYRDKMLESYPVLWNFVYVGNTPHIRFLKSIGAVFHEEYTRDGQFQLFTITRR